MIFILLSLLGNTAIYGQDTTNSKGLPDVRRPTVFKLHAISNIFTRFATTTVSSSILNPANVAQEVVFTVQLPNAAFISNFSMLLDDKIIVGDVRESEAARKQFEDAQIKGETAGLVARNARETNQFDISINVAPQDIAQFKLTYQEVLRRIHGVYKHAININPGGIVDDFLIQGQLIEKRNITFFRALTPDKKLSDVTNKDLKQREDDPDIDIEEYETEEGYHKITATFSPNQAQQRQYSAEGLDGMQFVVLYDVERDYSSGEIEVVNGYFVHFIAPTGDKLPVGNKHIVFVLDISGSMAGTKIRQLRESMELILNDLNPEDLFNIVTFSTNVFVQWPESIQANQVNKQKAIDFVGTLEATASTNIYGALDTGIKILKQNPSDTLESVIVFLTDGLPTVNVTDPMIILRDVNKWNQESKFSIHSVAFGDDTDFDVLRKISTQNRGIARKVYEDSDAALQLVGFYDETSSPLLTNLHVTYLNESVNPSSIVKDVEHTYYEGGEVIVVGQLNPDYDVADEDGTIVFGVDVTGDSANGPAKLDLIYPIPCLEICPLPIPRPFPCYRGGAVTHVMPDYCIYDSIYHPPFCPIRCPPPPSTTPKPIELLPPSSFGGFVERMWAYLTIKKLLHKAKFGSLNDGQQKSFTDRALYLAMKYKFVTELTSMVVTKPGQNTTVLTEIPPDSSSGSSSTGVGFMMSKIGSLGGTKVSSLVVADSFETEVPLQSTVAPTTPPSLNPNYLTTNDFSIFAMSTNYFNVTASSLEECAYHCYFSQTCSMATFFPAEKVSMKKKYVCAMSSYDVTNCPENKIDHVKFSDPIVVYCFTA